jgi:hypothetical protein
VIRDRLAGFRAGAFLDILALGIDKDEGLANSATVDHYTPFSLRIFLYFTSTILIITGLLFNRDLCTDRDFVLRQGENAHNERIYS